MLKSTIPEIFEILIKDLNSAFVQEENSETEGQELVYSCEAQQKFQAVWELPKAVSENNNSNKAV